MSDGTKTSRPPAPPGEDQAGQPFWRGLEEWAGTEEGRAMVERDFASAAPNWDDPVGRRRFLKLMGASLALAGASGCTRQPQELIVPYVRQPEEIVPGKPLYYATALSLGGYGAGVLVENHMGRPTKVEGNPEHPASLGAADVFLQAAVLGLYDPDRSHTLTHLGEIVPWGDLLETLRLAQEAQAPTGGAGIRILTETVTSPTLAAQIRQFLARQPHARWTCYEPAGRDAAREGARMAFGEPRDTRPRFDQARVILSLDADFLGGGPGHLRHVREFAARRRIRGSGDEMSRLYVVESAATNTGARADHRLPLRASRIGDLALHLAARLGVGIGDRVPSLPDGIPAGWAEALARDLERNRGAALVLAGDGQPAWVHAAAHAINHTLGAQGRTVVHTDPVEANPQDGIQSLGELVEEMRSGAVQLLLILGGNPVYSAPADLEFAAALEKVALRIHLSGYQDETSALCHWHVPEAHPLEAWSDIRAFDGTASIMQPMVEPLYGGRTAHEMMAAFSEQPNRRSHDIVRDHWRSRLPGPDFEPAWQRVLHDGLIPGTAAPARETALRADWHAGVPQDGGAGREADLEAVFRPDPSVHDGRFANNGWLQETPRPLTRLTWDNAVHLSPTTAAGLGVANEDEVEVALDGRQVRGPAWIVPGQADGTVVLHLGYGRSRAGRVGTGVGFDAGRVRTSAAAWIAPGIRLRPTGGRRPLACTQEHHSMEGRHLVREASLGDYRREPGFARHLGHDPAPDMTLYPPEHANRDGYAWGMAIDLGACIGCNACVVACQAENNVPVVGAEEIRAGREMHWLRVDRYFSGDPANPAVHHQPVACMHCENAPCEVVCPVAATVHSSEGLNDMVYNRCVGTRYCANNCPYKVRRFNFFKHDDYEGPTLKMLANPDVTIRSRGVMEKCSYCVQRINQARIQAGLEDRRIRDGEVVTACQGACPAEAISFGDLNDRQSRVARAQAAPLSYGILTELNTRPRTTYLAAVRNPNPEITPAEQEDGRGHS